MQRLGKDCFKRDAVEVAEDLVGKVLCVGDVCTPVVETEAYKEDAASHARTRTPRSAIMHDTYGHVYVYLVYGRHHCLNFTTDTSPGAVLIRAVEQFDEQRTDGPGRLTAALDVSTDDSGEVVGKRIKVFDDGVRPEIEKGTRIGISKAVDLEWRFFWSRHQDVSR